MCVCLCVLVRVLRVRLCLCKLPTAGIHMMALGRDHTYTAVPNGLCDVLHSVRFGSAAAANGRDCGAVLDHAGLALALRCHNSHDSR